MVSEFIYDAFKTQNDVPVQNGELCIDNYRPVLL